MELERSKSIRIDEIDKKELDRIKTFTGIPVVKLVHFAIPLLKKKYRVKESEPKGE